MSSGEGQSERPARGQPIGSRSVLQSLPTTARTTGEKAAARSRLVRRLRIALPIFGFVLIAGFFLNTRNQGADDVFLNEFEDLAAATEELKMANPRFAGIDEQGKPFEITADYAIQNQSNRDFVHLERPKAVQGKQGGANVVTAEKGVYQSESNILELSDGVQLEHQIGNDIYIFRSPAATVAISNETVTSEAGVGGEGPDGGSLRADRMKAFNADGKVVFEGNVSMRIYPKKETQTDDNNGGSERLDPPQTSGNNL